MNKGSNKTGFSRRDILKALGATPLLGAFTYAALKRNKFEKHQTYSIADELKLNLYDEPTSSSSSDGSTIRIGIIGTGIRGMQLLEAIGYAHPSLLQDWGKVRSKIEMTHGYKILESRTT